MTLHWFRHDRPAGEWDLPAYQAQLEPFGITLRPPVGTATYYIDEESGDLMMEIGTLFYWPASGEVRCIPRGGCGDAATVALLGAASKSLRENRFSKANGWCSIRRRHEPGKGQPGWRAEICIPLNETGVIARLIARSRETIDDANVGREVRVVERELAELDADAEAIVGKQGWR